MYLGRKSITYVLVVGVIVGTITAWIAHNIQYSRGETIQESGVIPFVVFPKDAFKQGYIDGYIEAKELSIIEDSNSIEIKINLTYIGRETAPKTASVRLRIKAPGISIPDHIIKSAFNKNNTPELQGVISYLINNSILEHDRQGRAWINLNRLIYIEPSIIKIERNTSTIVTVSIKPNRHLDLAAKSLLCYLLMERFTTIGIGGATSLSFYVESNPNIQSFPIVISTTSLIKHAICDNIYKTTTKR